MIILTALTIIKCLFMQQILLLASKVISVRLSLGTRESNPQSYFLYSVFFPGTTIIWHCIRPCWLVHCLSFWLECTLHEGRYFCLFYPFLFSPELNPVPDTCLVLKKSIQRSPGICRGLVPGLPWTPKSMDAQVLYIKWHSTVSLLYLQVRNPQIQRADYNR